MDAQGLALLQGEGHPLEPLGVPEVVDAGHEGGGHVGAAGPGGRHSCRLEGKPLEEGPEAREPLVAGEEQESGEPGGGG